MAKTIALLMFGAKKQMFYLFNSVGAAIKWQQEPSEVKKSISRQLILYKKQRGRKKLDKLGFTICAFPNS